MAPRALSMMSSASPSSQCGTRVQVAPPAGASAPTSPTSGWSWASCSPHIRRVTFASSPPTGMSRSGGFGMRRSRSSRSPSVSAREASRAVIRTPAAVEAARRSATSGPSGAAPALIASPICFETVFRSALRASFSASSRRRSASSSMARSTSAGSSPLRTAPSRMASASSRSRCRPTLMPAVLRRRSSPDASRSSCRDELRVEAGQEPAGARSVRATEEREVDRLECPSRRQLVALGDEEDQRLPRVTRLRAPLARRSSTSPRGSDAGRRRARRPPPGSASRRTASLADSGA